MTHSKHLVLGRAVVGFVLIAAIAQPVWAAPQAKSKGPDVPSSLGTAKTLSVNGPVNPHKNRPFPISGNWWMTYPWSSYNAWNNPYWYPPYHSYYPYRPYPAYPYYPYPALHPSRCRNPGVGSAPEFGKGNLECTTGLGHRCMR
jgi:hypothetical protein